ncbi:MAG TPA: MBOAT family O-acyltransferase [Candidatus Binatia bacterium]|nr:MBOAT family O-acyltransferase [Candidatus Binatia bacterium]
MLFNSAAFLFLYLPIVLAGTFVLARVRPRWTIAWLGLASFAFYADWNWRFLALLLASIAFNGWVGGRIAATRPARTWLVIGVAGDLLVLGVFKYANFIVGSVAAFGGFAAPHLGIVLPLGISFFTFTQIAFLVDAWRGEIEAHPRADSYALFVSYFPHLIAGPILHHGEMIPQFERKGAFRFDWENIAVGLTIFAIGLFKKVVIADGIAPLVKPAFDAAAAGQAVGAGAAWLGALAFALQLYFDFSGYSDMAIGLSRLIGVQLPLNFNSPYQATSAVDFWRRWHMTLSRFLRDYLYFPLGGNRLGPRRRYLNLMIVMLLGGLWHGAGWTYVIWGGLHGLYLVANHLWRGAFGADRMPAALARALTFLAVLVAWVPFRAADLGTALHLWSAMLGRGTPGETAITFADGIMLAVVLAIAWFAPNTQEIMARFRPGLDTERIAPARWPWRPNLATALIACGVLASSLYFVLFTHRVSEFLYFQF